MEFHKKELYAVIKNVPQSQKRDVLYKHILDTLKIDSRPLREDVEREFRQTLANFLSVVTKKINEFNRHEDRFLACPWAQQPLKLPTALFQDKENLKASKNVGGRPRNENFETLKPCTKRRRVKDVTNNYTASELGFACQMNLRKQGNRLAAEVVHQASTSSTTFTGAKCECVLPTKLSEEEAVALISSCHLTKENYLHLRKILTDHNVDVLPSYHSVLNGKKKCYPPSEEVQVTHSEAAVSVQGLFDLTARRLIEAHREVFESNPTISSLNMVWKWGFDGSTAHAERKQQSEEPIQESSIVLTAAVPLQVVSTSEDGSNKILWQNARPSSTRLCRPIQILNEKETKSFVLEHTASLKNTMKSLRPCTVEVSNSQTVTVLHKPFLSMIDGKVKATVCNTSAQTCVVCKAVPSEMNKIEILIKKSETVKPASMEEGISILHGWIRFLELCLNVAERLGVTVAYRQYTPAEKANIAERKTLIRDTLRKEMGLLVNKPKSVGGSGSTNDGNTARRFFQDPSKTAAFTGLDADFLERVRNIMIVLSCGYAINVSEFKAYAHQTAYDYARLYPWYYMSSSVHNILIHGADHIKTAGIPIGLFSEEALESRHKDLRYYRRHHVRLSDRAKEKTDLLHALLISSDPVINQYKNIPKRRHLTLPTAVIQMLAESRGSEALIDIFEDDEADEFDEFW